LTGADNCSDEFSHVSPTGLRKQSVRRVFGWEKAPFRSLVANEFCENGSQYRALKFRMSDVHREGMERQVVGRLAGGASRRAGRVYVVQV
jgi:hypothetical protein